MAFKVRHLETHVTHSCNFTCESCTHFSQDGHSGRETPQSFLQHLSPWATRLVPEWFLILGGEPLMNPQLLEILPIARQLWPGKGVRIALVTNGWLLSKLGKQLAKVLAQNDIYLDVSLHHDDPHYLSHIMNELVTVCEGREGVKVHVRQSYNTWDQVYKGDGAGILPFHDNNQRQSWQKCESKWCMNIYEGKLYKCPPLAYLPMQKKKFPNLSSEWDPYLKYESLEPTCTDLELSQFISRQDEAHCAMCPANPVKIHKPLPVKMK